MDNIRPIFAFTNRDEDKEYRIYASGLTEWRSGNGLHRRDEPWFQVDGLIFNYAKPIVGLAIGLARKVDGPSGENEKLLQEYL